MNEKNQNEGEEYGKSLLGYVKLRTDPTVLKFPPDFASSLNALFAGTWIPDIFFF